MIIAVDCGATNLRCRLMEGDRILDEVREKCGSRNGVFAGNTTVLEEALANSIRALLERNKLRESDVEMVVSAGVLASPVGLYHVPHVEAPVGITESARAARQVSLPHISGIPFLFIPGVRRAFPTQGALLDRIVSLESMSGEECEAYGIAAQLGLVGPYLMVMPGSYCQSFLVDAEGRIDRILTGMCGELIAATSEHTLLKKTLPQPVVREILEESLFLGYDYAAAHGSANAFIKARMVQVWGDFSLDEAGNFLVGAILQDNVRLILENAEPGLPVVVGGSDPLRSLLSRLLRHAGLTNVITVDDATAYVASAIGATLVYRAFREI